MFGLEPSIYAENWIKSNFYLTLNEKELFASWINEYGLLPIQDAMFKIYDEYRAEEMLNSAGLFIQMNENEGKEKGKSE